MKIAGTKKKRGVNIGVKTTRTNTIYSIVAMTVITKASITAIPKGLEVNINFI